MFIAAGLRTVVRTRPGTASAFVVDSLARRVQPNTAYCSAHREDK